MEKKNRPKNVRELPPVGTNLEAEFRGVKYKAKIVSNKNSPYGKAIKFRGKIYRSMTAAAEAITQKPTNGWRFWKF